MEHAGIIGCLMSRSTRVSHDDVRQLGARLNDQGVVHGQFSGELLERITCIAASIPKPESVDNLESVRTPAFFRAIKSLNLFIINAGEACAHELLTAKHWFTLQNILLLGMHFRTAHICRRNATSQVISKYDALSSDSFSKSDLLLMAACAAESRGVKLANRFFDIYATLPNEVAKLIRPAVRGLILLKNGSAEYRYASRVTTAENNDERFSTYLAGKSIAIVGPVDVGLENGKEIDGHDVVIRFNHTSNSSYDVERFGSRTDVSYYTNPAFKRLVLKNADMLAALEFAVLQDLAGTGVERLKYRCVFRSQYRRSNAIFFKSHGNAVQRLLLDVLRFDTGGIKLFNMNMWLTPHMESYLARRKQLDPHTFIYHDPVTNVSFLRKLLNNGAIEADLVLEKILGFTDDEYVAELSRRYSSCGATK